MSLIFIAAPTKGVVTDGKLNESFIQNVAAYHRIFPNLTFIAPMIQDYVLLPYLQDMDATWDVWGKHCERSIKVCDEVWVIQFDSWETSVGVEAEIELAKTLGKKLVFMRPCI